MRTPFNETSIPLLSGGAISDWKTGTIVINMPEMINNSAMKFKGERMDIPAPNPDTKRATRNIPTWTDPVCKAPPINVIMVVMLRVLFRPYTSLIQAENTAPKTPPAEKMPFIAPMIRFV